MLCNIISYVQIYLSFPNELFQLKLVSVRIIQESDFDLHVN